MNTERRELLMPGGPVIMQEELFSDPSWKIHNILRELSKEDVFFPKTTHDHIDHLNVYQTVLLNTITGTFNCKIVYHTYIQKLVRYLRTADIIKPEWTLPQVDYKADLLNITAGPDQTLETLLLAYLEDPDEDIRDGSFTKYQEALFQNTLTKDILESYKDPSNGVVFRFRDFVATLSGYIAEQLLENRLLPEYILNFKHLGIKDTAISLIEQCTFQEMMQNKLFDDDVYAEHAGTLYEIDPALVNEVDLANHEKMISQFSKTDPEDSNRHSIGLNAVIRGHNPDSTI